MGKCFLECLDDYLSFFASKDNDDNNKGDEEDKEEPHVH